MQSYVNSLLVEEHKESEFLAYARGSLWEKLSELLVKGADANSDLFAIFTYHIWKEIAIIRSYSAMLPPSFPLADLNHPALLVVADPSVKKNALFSFFSSISSPDHHPKFAEIHRQIQWLEKAAKTCGEQLGVKEPLERLCGLYRQYIEWVIAIPALAPDAFLNRVPALVVGKDLEAKALNEAMAAWVALPESVQAGFVAGSYRFDPPSSSEGRRHFAVSSLEYVLTSQSARMPDLCKVFTGSGDVRLYEVSPILSEHTLHDILQTPLADLASQYDVEWENFSEAFVIGLLVGPLDATADQYAVEYTEKRHVRLYGMDAAFAWGDSTWVESDEAGQKRRVPLIKQVLYFLPHMQLPFSNAFREALLKTTPERVMLEWLALLGERQALYDTLLSDGCAPAKTPGELQDFFFGTRLKIGVVATVYAKLCSLFDLLRQLPIVTHQALFERLEPELAEYYHCILAEHDQEVLRSQQALYETSFSNEAERLEWGTRLNLSGRAAFRACGREILLRSSPSLSLRKGCSSQESLIQLLNCIDYKRFETWKENVAPAGEGEVAAAAVAVEEDDSAFPMHFFLRVKALFAASRAHQSLLHLAAEYRNLGLARYLLAHQLADPDYLNDALYTAAHIAASQGDIDFLKLLQQHGAHLHLPDKLGQTPLDKARRKGKVGTVAWLQSTQQTEGACVISALPQPSFSPLSWVSSCLEQGDETPQTVILLDVDNTIVNSQGELNLALLQALRHHPADALFLVTSYSLHYNALHTVRHNSSRMDMVRRLARYGVWVDGVITSNTPYIETVNDPLGTYYAETVLPCERQIKKNRLRYPDAPDHALRHPHQQVIAEEVASIECHIQSEPKEESLRQGKFHLLQHVLSRLPRHSQILVYDDKLEVINVVKHLIEKSSVIVEKELTLFYKRVDYRFYPGSMADYQKSLTCFNKLMPHRVKESAHVILISSEVLVEQAKKGSEAQYPLLQLLKTAEGRVLCEVGDEKIDEAARAYIHAHHLSLNAILAVPEGIEAAEETLLVRWEAMALWVGRTLRQHPPVDYRLTVIANDGAFLEGVKKDYPNDKSVLCLGLDNIHFLPENYREQIAKRDYRYYRALLQMHRSVFVNASLSLEEYQLSLQLLLELAARLIRRNEMEITLFARVLKTLWVCSQQPEAPQAVILYHESQRLLSERVHLFRGEGEAPQAAADGEGQKVDTYTHTQSTCYGMIKDLLTTLVPVDQLGLYEAVGEEKDSAPLPPPLRDIVPFQPWHSAAVRAQGMILLPPGSQYALLDPMEPDLEKVFSCYLRSPVTNHEIADVRVVYNPTMEKGFSIYLRLLQQREGNLVFAPRWREEEEPELREAVATSLEEKAKQYRDNEHLNVTLLPLWHGTAPQVVPSICNAGFANLALTDSGFFGKGLYSAYEAEYAHRVYSKGTLLINWVACYSAYPVIQGDMPKLAERGNYANYDAHYIPVRPRDPANPNEVNYYPCGINQKPTYHELVVFNLMACMPRYLVQLKKSTVNRLRGPESYMPFFKSKKVKEAHAKQKNPVSDGSAILKNKP
ncbi:MAG: hypothetical protein K0R24_360 [Gammaproteobacteria bacterium]|jgi:hypothetical protein|nr:hypothetical protein [Gammaproteobacteria bacterium]